MQWSRINNNLAYRKEELLKLKGVVFDMDGTVVEVPYDWKQIKEELMTQGKPVLTFIQSLEEPERSEKWKVLEKFENEATLKAVLKDGMQEFLDFLKEEGIKKALATNNSQRNVSFILNKFKLEFDYVLSREKGLWKPSGAPLLFILKKLNLKKEECCVVGDSHFDIKAADEAGITKIFILNEDKKYFSSTQAEVFKTVIDLKERIKQILETEE